MKAGVSLFCNITLVKTKELLLPKQVCSFYQTDHKTGIYLEIPSGTECLNYKHPKTFTEPCVVISRRLQLVNPTEAPIVLRGFIFQLNELQPLLPLHQEIACIERQHLKKEMFLDIFAALFADPGCQKNIVRTEEAFPFFLQFLRTSEAQTSSPFKLTGKIDPRLIYIHRYIRKHYSEPIMLHSLAELIDCNPVYLSNMYSKLFGISPIKHLQQVRMKQAAKLLQTSTSINEIAKRVGYISASQFSELFKRYYAESPRDYKHKFIT